MSKNPYFELTDAFNQDSRTVLLPPERELELTTDPDRVLELAPRYASDRPAARAAREGRLAVVRWSCPYLFTQVSDEHGGLAKTPDLAYDQADLECQRRSRGRGIPP